MRRSASLSSFLALLALGAASGCGGNPTQTTSTGTAGTAGTGGSGATAGTGGTTATTGGTGGTTATTGGTGGTTATTGGTGGTTTTTGTGGTGGMIEPVVDCNVPDFVPPQDANATCEVTTPGTAGLILRGTVLMPDQVMHKGQVFITAAGTIACADCDCSAAQGADMATVVTCANGVISPALINPHDHITYAQNPPKAHLDSKGQPSRYDHRNQWRLGDGADHPQIKPPGSAPADQVRLAELRFVMSGATSAAAAGAVAGLLRNLDAKGMAEGITLTVDSDTFPLDDLSGVLDDNASDGCTFGGSPTKASQILVDNAYLPHISEGIDDFSHTEFLCTSSAPPPANANDIIEPKTAIIHAVAIDAMDVDRVRADTAKVIWSPRSNVDLYGNTAQVTLLDTMGVPIALGTDWLPSGSMNMLRELRCADELNTQYFAGHFTDKQLWQMVTTNASLAVGTDSVLGMIKPGYLADISIFNSSMNKDHRAVVGAQLKDVVLVMRGGKILYGDDAIVDDLRPNCETLDVCTSAKRACVAQDLNNASTLAALLTASNSSYPLLFCPSAANPDGTPNAEPSCVPYRPNEYSGIVAGTDDDGDGVANGTDNCAMVFDPKRPMDNQQADSDGDNKGDVCDPCPLDAKDACPTITANDLDEDGILNGYDNCPYKANLDQADSDKDGHGDACDKCPMDPNLGLDTCPVPTLPIKAIRDPKDPMHPAMGDMVTISAYVTAIRPKTGASQGYYVQDASLMPFSGIFIFTAAKSPTVQIGNKVTVTGTYSEFFELSELSEQKVVIDDPGMTLPFSPIDIADPSTIATGGAMAEGYESMLLKIGMVSVTNINPDGAQDFDEFAVTGNLRIDDTVFDNVKDMGLDNKCAVGKGFKSITGIGAFAFANYKLEPRFTADIELLDAADPNYCKPSP